jgi:hypothetical protein
MLSKFKKAMIVVYMGKIPPYFQLWTKSCSYNEDYDFLFFTDQHIERESLPKNFLLHSITLDNVNERLGRMFGNDCKISSNYKLCDLRPLYGEIFSEELNGYDFWGHCDTDLIFGNISHFLTDDILSKYDKVLTLGHFTLYRNTDFVNSVYRTKDKRNRYKEMLATNNSCFFDEGIFNQIIPLYRKKKLFPVWLYDDRYNVNSIFADNNIPIYINFDIIADINYFEDNLQLCWGSCVDYRDSNSMHSVFCWEKGRLRRYYLNRGEVKNEEFMYIHLQKRSMENRITDVDSDKFFILKHSFEDHHKITTDFLKHSNVNVRSFKDIKKACMRKIKHNGHRMKVILQRFFNK